MSHGKTALTLMMALALPGAAQALGLGEIHLDSALNEPLAANIDIVGATAEDLEGITASIANRETFEHFDVDRLAFLSTVVFKIAHDSRGRAVLAIRSTEACTEPLLNMLVDVRWRGGELVRQYTLLLDPPGFSSAAPAAEAVVGAPVNTAPVSVRAAVSEKGSTTLGEPAARKTMRVGAKATLRGVAWRVGSRSEADRQRMMIAIFRMNPNAFEGNINRLRRGALLTIPSAAEVSAVSVHDAHREVHAQMQAWHAATPGASPTKSVMPAVAAPAPSPSVAAVPSPPVAGSAESAAIARAGAANAPRTAAEPDAPVEAALDRRVQQLESRLDAVREQLDREHDALVRTQAQLTVAEEAPEAAAPPQTNSGRGIGSTIAALIALAAAAFGIYAWRRRKGPAQEPRPALVVPELQNLAPVQVTAQAAVREAAAPSVQHETHRAPPATPSHAAAGERQSAADALAAHRSSAATAPNRAVNLYDAVDAATLEASYLLEAGEDFDDAGNFGDTAILPVTVKLRVDDPNAQTMPVETAAVVGDPESTARVVRAPENAMPATKARSDATKLDYNLVDLDATVQHVQMPSALHENAGFTERRTSLVDALKSAMEREPNRLDLRMKLLETYYTAAATNRQGFLDIARKIAEQRASLNADEWEKIARMGRQIAADDSVFAAEQPDEEDVANCA
jgi:pilus assembly protein FimV